MKNLLIKILGWLISLIPREVDGRVDGSALGCKLSAVILIVSLLVCGILGPSEATKSLSSIPASETSLKLGQETRILYIYEMDGTPKWFITVEKVDE